jgi:hypothetical protein
LGLRCWRSFGSLFTSLLSSSILKLAPLLHSSPGATSPGRLTYRLQLLQLIKRQLSLACSGCSRHCSRGVEFGYSPYSSSSRRPSPSCSSGSNRPSSPRSSPSSSKQARRVCPS